MRLLGRGRGADPFPPSVAEASVQTPSPADLDSIDLSILARVQSPRMFKVGSKRILRGRVPGGDMARPAIERELAGLPVDFFFERVGAETFVTVSRPKTRSLPRAWPKNLLLFLLTLFTTTWGGAYWSGIDPFAGSTFTAPNWQSILGGLGAGLPFSLALLTILTCHEFGHYITARRYGLEATLPFYLPVPPFLSPIGTLGAVIKMGTPLYSRRILLDVGVAGPLAGIAVALPILAWGILHAPRVAVTDGAGLYFSEPLLFSALERLLRPDLAAGGDIEATSLVLAGWLGLFVTALNLLPVGQLDGGHIAFALLGRGQYVMGALSFLALAILGVLWMGWWVWVLLILAVVRVKHPPILDLDLPLDGRRKALGWLTILLLLLCFHPVPFEIR